MPINDTLRGAPALLLFGDGGGFRLRRRRADPIRRATSALSSPGPAPPDIVPRVVANQIPKLKAGGL
jgi:hypothetical protein